MAKKKANKRSALSKNLQFFAVLLALGAVAFIFAPVIASGETLYSGIQATFGTKILDIPLLPKGEIPFSIASFAGYLVILLGAVFALISDKKLGVFLAGVLCAIGAVLIFLIGNFTVIKITSVMGNATQKVEWDLQWGAIATGVLAILAAIVNLYNSFALKKR